MSMQEKNPDYVDPWINAMGSFSMLFGIASFFIAPAIFFGLLAVVLGVIAKVKGANNSHPIIGMITGALSSLLWVVLVLTA